MKKLLAIFLVISILFTFASCGGKEEEKTINNNDIVENNDNQQNIENNDVADNKQDIPEELTIDYVKNYPVTDTSQFEVTETEDGVIISSYIGSDEIVVVPEQINGKPVTTIEIRAFLTRDSIRAVKLSDTVKEVGREAFMGCKNLEIFICGKNLETIKEYGLSACTSLTHIELNDGLKVLETLAIPEAKLLEMRIPSSVELIYGGGAFLNPELKIICEAGSYAETYATDNNLIVEVR